MCVEFDSGLLENTDRLKTGELELNELTVEGIQHRLVYTHTQTQRNQKVFRPLDFFPILLRYSLILKCIHYFFPSSIYIQFPKMTQ